MSSRLNLVILFTISFFVYFFVWLRNTPYPLHLNWDIYEHITLANKISQGHLSILASQITDTFTFDGQSPLFHILLSIPKVLFRTDLLGAYYYLEYFYFALTIFATFIFAHKVFKNDWIAFIAGIFSIFIFENFVAYTSFFLIPQNLAALLVIFTLIYVLRENVKKFYLGGLLLLIFLIHYVIGALGILIVLGFILLRKVSTKTLNWVILASTLALFLLLALHFSGNLQLTNREEALHYIFPLQKELGFLLDWYSLSFLFLPLGYYHIFKNGVRDQKIILILALLTLGVSLAPLSYFLKFFVFDHYLLNLVLAAGVGFIIANLPKFLKVLAIAWISFCFLIVFFKSQNSYKDPLYFDGKASHISYAEIDASNWLSKNAGKEILLVSDPGTQYILEATSGVNTQGGAYMSEQTRKVLSEINNSQDTQDLLGKLRSIKDNLNYENQVRTKTIFVLSGRYFAWQNLPQDQKKSFFYNVWTPQKIKPEDNLYIDFLINSKEFKLLYRNGELAILEL